jgi:hypothetical protein
VNARSIAELTRHRVILRHARRNGKTLRTELVARRPSDHRDREPVVTAHHSQMLALGNLAPRWAA